MATSLCPICGVPLAVEAKVVTGGDGSASIVVTLPPTYTDHLATHAVPAE